MIDIDKVRRDSFNAMWGFLQMGGQKSNVPSLKEHCEALRKLMTQKTAGQRPNNSSDISFDDVYTVMNFIVIEAMCLYLSGDLDQLEGVR